MRKMVALSQCCSVTGILGWEKLILGRKEPCLEQDDANVVDHQ